MNINTRALSVLATCTLSLNVAACAGGTGDTGATDEALADVAEPITEAVCPSNVPAAIVPPAGQTLKLSLTGLGVQIYMCTAKGETFSWTPVGPQANLLDDDGKLVGTHFIGPTWQGNDGSSVVGQKTAGVSVDPSAVPWLLLTAVSHASEPGRFSDVTFIQRLSTVGGNAPSDGCDAAHIATLAQVPYTAQYAFYKAKAHGNVKVCGG